MDVDERRDWLYEICEWGIVQGAAGFRWDGKTTPLNTQAFQKSGDLSPGGSPMSQDQFWGGAGYPKSGPCGPQKWTF